MSDQHALDAYERYLRQAVEIDQHPVTRALARKRPIDAPPRVIVYSTPVQIGKSFAQKMYEGSMSRRRGFTLVELLVVMVIIAGLAGMVMGGLFLAQEKAKATRTRTIITKLNQTIAARWESYRTRRLPYSTTDPAFDPTPMPISPFTQADSAFVRLAMMRELMRLEMPTRYADITTDVADRSATLWNTPACPPPAVNSGAPLPAANSTYRLKISKNTHPNFAAIAAENQSAECLYMIVASARSEESQELDRFRHEDTEDTDDDGMLEFVDGWGQPISFVRWPAGWVSDLQPDADPATVDDPTTPEVEFLERDAVNNHDPFDNMKLDMPTAPDEPRGWRLWPLIYSVGPDGDGDIFTVNAGATAAELNDPYYRPAAGQFAGEPYDTAQDGAGHVDNIHSHLLGGSIR